MNAISSTNAFNSHPAEKHYTNYEEIVGDARMQRSVAIAALIAGVIGATSRGISRLFGASAARSSNRPAEASAHR